MDYATQMTARSRHVNLQSICYAEAQKRLGIESNVQREEHWIQELMSFSVFPVLFILGADHIDSFERLLRERGLSPFVIARDWKPSDAAQAV